MHEKLNLIKKSKLNTKEHQSQLIESKKGHQKAVLSAGYIYMYSTTYFSRNKI
jgi:hypothetical protein